MRNLSPTTARRWANTWNQATGERVAALESIEPAAEAEKLREQVPAPELTDDRDRRVEREPGPSWEMPMEWREPELEL